MLFQSGFEPVFVSRFVHYKKGKLFLKQQFFLIFLFCYNCFKPTSKEVTNSQPMASRFKPVLNLFSTWFIMLLQVIHTRKIFSHGKWGKLSIATNLFLLSQCHTPHCSEFQFCTVNFLFSFSFFKPLQGLDQIVVSQ